MKPYPYMVSVQWGSGPHYFVGGALTRVGAEKLAEGAYESAAKTRAVSRRAPKPRAMVWELKHSVQDDELGPLVWAQPSF